MDMDALDWLASMDDTVTDEDLGDLKALFVRFADVDGYPIVPTPVWDRINAKYRQKDVKMAFCQHIVEHKVPLPIHAPTVDDARIAFTNLRALRHPFDVIKPFKEFKPRVPYRHIDGIETVVVRNSSSNDASNHFQWANRMQCGGWGDPSPIEAWSSVKALYNMRWTFWSLDRGGPTSRKVWRTSFLNSSGGMYQAAQFRPSAAKSLYGWLGGGVVVDPSCGWGDRLCGFYATETTTRYVGCDPNPDTWAIYRKQCLAYEGWLGNANPTVNDITVNGRPAFRIQGVKDVTIVNGPFEDIPWMDLMPDGADIVFTSPPYFSTERYASHTDKAEDQSWSRYTTFDGWRDHFYFHVIKVSGDLVRKRDGIVLLNIADPLIGLGKNKVRHEACDPGVDYAQSIGMRYVGASGLELSLRPSSSTDRSGLKQGAFIEPIWMFTWGRDCPAAPVSDVEHMLGDASDMSFDDDGPVGGDAPSTGGAVEPDPAYDLLDMMGFPE